MTALITLSHGSRHPEAASSVEALTRAAGVLTGVPAVAAHLEFNTPTLEAAAQGLAARGEREAVVVPLLFTEGYHQRVDVPAAIDSASASSGLILHRARGLGTGEDMAQLLATRVPEEASKVVVYSVGSSDASANAAVAELARRVGEIAGCECSTAYATGPKAAAEQNLSPREHGEVVVPLFVSLGLLLDRLDGGLTTASQRQVLPPLGTALAEIVSQRYQEVAHA